MSVLNDALRPPLQIKPWATWAEDSPYTHANFNNDYLANSPLVFVQLIVEGTYALETSGVKKGNQKASDPVTAAEVLPSKALPTFTAT